VTRNILIYLFYTRYIINLPLCFFYVHMLQLSILLFLILAFSVSGVSLLGPFQNHRRVSEAEYSRLAHLPEDMCAVRYGEHGPHSAP
jgi:hypothetical protein